MIIRQKPQFSPIDICPKTVVTPLHANKHGTAALAPRWLQLHSTRAHDHNWYMQNRTKQRRRRWPWRHNTCTRVALVDFRRHRRELHEVSRFHLTWLCKRYEHNIWIWLKLTYNKGKQDWRCLWSLWNAGLFLAVKPERRYAALALEPHNHAVKFCMHITNHLTKF